MVDSLQVSGTHLTEFPAALFARLAYIPHLSLDFRENRLRSLRPRRLSTGTRPRGNALAPPSFPVSFATQSGPARVLLPPFPVLGGAFVRRPYVVPTSPAGEAKGRTWGGVAHSGGTSADPGDTPTIYKLFAG